MNVWPCGLFLCVFYLCVPLLLTSATTAGDDPVGAYLDELGLTELLAVHLEERLEVADSEKREAILHELAELYTALLATEDDPARREAIEKRSRALLEHAPEDGAAELRLALLRGTFQQAEQTAERHRLRLADDEEISRALEQLDEIIPEMRDVQQTLERHINRIVRQRGNDENRREWMRHQVERMQQLEAQSRFLNAWALYYRASLNRDREGDHLVRDDAEAAQRLFAEFLRLDSPHARPETVSTDLRDTEPFARSILGMALCRSMTATSVQTALDWLELLEHENTHRDVRAEAPGWKLAVKLEHEQYRPARLLLEVLVEGDDEVPLSWLRLAAVHALSADDTNRDVGELVVFAVTRIAGRGELRQVLALAEKYGIEALPEAGFAHDYIRGVMRYREARDAHGEDDIATAEDVLALYRDAARSLRAAIEHGDAAGYPEAVASCQGLLGWSAFYQGEYREAGKWFERASHALSGEQAAEALWMAIVCHDRLLRDAHEPQLRQQHAALVDVYLREHPDSPRASQLYVSRAAQRDELTDEEIRELLAIPGGYPGAARGRRIAAQALYQRYRAVEGQTRAQAGDAYLDVVVPLLRDAHLFDDLAEETRSERRLLLARQVLEVALSSSAQRARPAQAAFAVIDELARDGPVDLDAIEDELTYRRLRLSLLTGMGDAAANDAEALWQRDQESIWARQATRTMFQHAHAQWFDQQPHADEPSIEVLEQVAQYGGRVLREFEDDPDWSRQPHLVQAHAIVAEASMTLWERTDETARGRAALFLYQRLLEQQPRQVTYLRNAAILAEEFSEYEFALQCWRTIASGSARGETLWYEARYRLIAILARTNPDRAREVLAQHRHLYPDFGPEPWGERFRALEEQLQSMLDDERNHEEPAS